jgi:hypothetical protein
MMKSGKVTEPDSGYQRLEQQIQWYDTRSMSSQFWFKRVKITEVICAAFVPFTSFINSYVTAILGVIIVLLETLQHLYQWQHNWVSYRSTCEALRHEKYCYLGHAGPYDGANDETAKKVLVERVESLISTEHSKWISVRENATQWLGRK